MLALHPPISSQERAHNQLTQRQSSSSSTATTQSKRTTSSSRPTSSSTKSSSSDTHNNHSNSNSHSVPPPALHPQDQPPSKSSTKNQNQPPELAINVVSSLPADPFQPFDINSLPTTELLPLIANLLTDIASTNDHLRNPDNRSLQLQDQQGAPSTSNNINNDTWNSLFSASKESLSTPSSTLSFHARHAPSITLASYLTRIVKYCPVANVVFISILVYFNRMTILARKASKKDFYIDSYNVHRLVIAGITVASKFHSDVFYTNSRYAKVGGLPQQELNQLELQFLLLNNFSLAISPKEMQSYASQLVAYSRESRNTIPTSPLFDKSAAPPLLDPVLVESPACTVGSVLSSVVAVQQHHQNVGDIDGSYDTEDETICPSHSSGASETSSIFTVRNDEDNDKAD